MDIDRVQVLTNTVPQLRSTQRPAFGALDAVTQGVSDAGAGILEAFFLSRSGAGARE